MADVPERNGCRYCDRKFTINPLNRFKVKCRCGKIYCSECDYWVPHFPAHCEDARSWLQYRLGSDPIGDAVIAGILRQTHRIRDLVSSYPEEILKKLPQIVAANNEMSRLGDICYWVTVTHMLNPVIATKELTDAVTSVRVQLGTLCEMYPEYPKPPSPKSPTLGEVCCPCFVDKQRTQQPQPQLPVIGANRLIGPREEAARRAIHLLNLFLSLMYPNPQDLRLMPESIRAHIQVWRSVFQEDRRSTSTGSRVN